MGCVSSVLFPHSSLLLSGTSMINDPQDVSRCILEQPIIGLTMELYFDSGLAHENLTSGLPIL